MSYILMISRYYPPEIGAAGVCVSETAKRLVKLGHRVTVLTTIPNYPTGVVPPEYRRGAIDKPGGGKHREVIDGVEVVRVWSSIAPNKGFLRRILAQLSFGCLAAFLAWGKVGRPDIVIVGSPPLFNVIAGRILARWKRVPLVFMVADLWPESAVQLGALRNRLFIRLAEWLAWSTYRRSQLVWVVTEGIRTLLMQGGLDPERIFLLTNGVDTKKFRPMPMAEARAALGWDERFVVLYAGGHGVYHGLMTVIEAAEQLRDREDIRFVLAGEGGEKAALIARAQERGLTNVTFLDQQPHHKIPLLIAASDASLSVVKNVPLFQGMLPIKMYEGMACARPILLAVDGEARQLAEKEAGAALHVEPENASALVKAIMYLREHPQEATALGERGRTYVETHFDYDMLTTTLNMRLLSLMFSKEGSATTSTAQTPVGTTNQTS